MCSLESLKIDLKALKGDREEFGFNLGDDYFEAIGGSEVRRGNVAVGLTVRRTAGLYELLIHHEGTVMVPCDICLEDMEQAVEADNRLTAKLGSEYSEEDDLITVEAESGVLDLSWFVYEFIALSIPIKHVHAPGNCNPAMIEALEEHSANRSGDEEEKGVDPRWSELEKLKTIIKD